MRALSRSTILLTSAAVLATGLVGVAPAQAGAACAVTTVAVTQGAVRTDLHNTACGDTWYVLNSDSTHGDEYTVTRVRDSGAKSYHLSVVPVGAAAFTEALIFDVTVDTSTDAVRVASGRADLLDVGFSVPGLVTVTASPTQATLCAPAGDPTTCTPATATVLEADLSFDEQYANIASAIWSAPVDTRRLTAACPVASSASDAIGVRMTLQGPALTETSATNLVDSLLVLPQASTTSCFGIDADAFASQAVVLADGVRIPAVASPAGAQQYGLLDESDCGGACVALSGVGFASGTSHTFVVAYAYTSRSAARARGIAGIPSKNTRRWAISLKSGSSPACIQNGAVVSALRTSSMGSRVTCKYTLSYQRKAGKKWKTKRVGGAFVA